MQFAIALRSLGLVAICKPLFLRCTFFSSIHSTICASCISYFFWISKMLMHILDVCRTADIHRMHIYMSNRILCAWQYCFGIPIRMNLWWNFFWLFAIGLIKFAFKMRRSAHISDGNCFERMHSCEMHFVKISNLRSFENAELYMRASNATKET